MQLEMVAMQDQRAPPPAGHALLVPTPIRQVMQVHFVHLFSQIQKYMI
jgi:hypothetical protein